MTRLVLMVHDRLHLFGLGARDPRVLGDGELRLAALARELAVAVAEDRKVRAILGGVARLLAAALALAVALRLLMRESKEQTHDGGALLVSKTY